MENMEQNGAIEARPSSLHTVTPLSKYLAMALFVILPFIGGWIGYTYAPEKIIKVEKTVLIEQEQSIPIPDNSTNNIEVDDTRGYLARNILTELVSPSGNTLTLVEYDNAPRYTHSCKDFFMTEEQREQGNVGILPLVKRSCEILITTPEKELFYRDFELQMIGGEPYRWLDDTYIATHATQWGGYMLPSFSTAGIFSTQDELFEEVFVSESPGIHWRRKFITHDAGRFLLAEGPETYNLYRITTPRDFYDFFSIDKSAEKTMVESLKPETMSELVLIGSIPHESEHQITVTTDLDKNILFSFGLHSDTPSINMKNYLFDISANSIEPTEINWGM